ncbi:MAG TPA: Gfo/Idh/MocA family oxidoreductase [Chloroflexota bacterium]|jgi:predicted dehydrogenase|nr:Gfo/Idh/MocA family oxidoreductase [Chloroflexota bacterium]
MTTNTQMPILRVGMAGLGTAVPNALPELHAHPGIRITAAADPRHEALDKFSSEFGGETYASVEAMCESRNVDAVYILTPNHLHAEHAIIAANHGKQVFCDKPMALTLDECDRMIEAADRNGVRLITGHSQAMDAPIRAMAHIVGSGELGAPLMINTWFYSDWLYRPRGEIELDPSMGEGLVRRQGPVQVEIARMLGGGLVRSVRGTTTIADPTRPVEGSYTAYLEFENRASATLAYNAYGYFDTTELHWGIGLQGNVQDPRTNANTRRRIKEFSNRDEEIAYKNSTRYGGARSGPGLQAGAGPDKRHAFFGITLVSCEKGDIRQSPSGLLLYDERGMHEIDVAPTDNYLKRYTATEVELMYDAWAADKPLAAHDGRWGKATTEVVLGIIESSAERHELMMQHQVEYPRGVWAALEMIRK